MSRSLPHLSHPKYRPDINGLRAIAVLSVVVFHAFPDWMKGGFIGVDVFFVISGFLISTIIFEGLDKGTFSFVEFYTRRVRRIFPSLIVVMLSCLIFGWFVLVPNELKQLGRHVAAGASFISNFALWSEAGYFDNNADTKPLLHLWSLGIEEQFYMFWPLFLWLAWKRKFNLLAVTLFVAIVSFAANIQGVKEDPVGTFYSPLTRIWELLCGAALAWFSLGNRPIAANINNGWATLLLRFFGTDERENIAKITTNLLSILGLCLLVYGFWQIDKEYSFPGNWALVPVFATILVISAGPTAWINHKILSNRIIEWFGLISFPLYLWHWPILSFGRIIYFEVPSAKFRLIAISVSILLAWLTVELVEKPFRFGNRKRGLKVAVLSGSIFMIAVFGLLLNEADLSQSHKYEKLAIKRKSEHAIGSSLTWYRGKDDWLFLGNAYDNTVAKLKLANAPTDRQIESVKEAFFKVANTGFQYNTKVVLFLGPDKSSIYPEYLPDELVPSNTKYSSYFLNQLKEVPNLNIYDPTDDLLRLKKSEGFLYWMTDTHWNSKGAFLAYSGFLKLFNLPVPEVKFQQGSTHIGDLINISKVKNFPLHAEDNWDVFWKDKPIWKEEIQNEQKTAFGSASIVTNENWLSNKHVWVVGDSFAGGLKQYFNATFKEVRYVGHWAQKLNDLPSELVRADKKPDMIIIVRVERSF